MKRHGSLLVIGLAAATAIVSSPVAAAPPTTPPDAAPPTVAEPAPPTTEAPPPTAAPPAVEPPTPAPPTTAAPTTVVASTEPTPSTEPAPSTSELVETLPAARTYLILGQGNSLPADLAAQVAAAGGTITQSVPAIGVAVATSDRADFATAIQSIRGIRSVNNSPRIQRLEPTTNVVGPAPAEYGNPPTSGDDDRLFELQWGHDAVDAPEAWNEGRRGNGAVVAVLDTGFDLTHPDLAPNIIGAQSFVPGEGAQWTGDVFSHGTHTAGTVAAADNGLGTIGVAPEARLLLGKVLPDAGCGGDGPILAGMAWAADNGADVISLSLGAPLVKSGYLEPGCDPGPEDDVYVTANEVAEIRIAYDRAVKYANDRGATVIASAGNDGVNSNQSANLIHLPGDAVGVISISATAPHGWARDPDTFLDHPASYSNYGRSTIDFSAPGGDIAEPLDTGSCTVGGITRPCYVFDLVFSTGAQHAYYWSAGTSMAAPHAAGVAALVIAANGGSMRPNRVETELARLADRIGGGGNHPVYGRGAIDATNSVEND